MQRREDLPATYHEVDVEGYEIELHSPEGVEALEDLARLRKLQYEIQEKCRASNPYRRSSAIAIQLAKRLDDLNPGPRGTIWASATQVLRSSLRRIRQQRSIR